MYIYISHEHINSTQIPSFVTSKPQDVHLTSQGCRAARCRACGWSGSLGSLDPPIRAFLYDSKRLASTKEYQQTLKPFPF